MSAIDDAIAVATTAIEAEKCGRLVEAKDKLTEAAGLMIKAAQSQSNVAKRSILLAEAKILIEKGEYLATRIRDEKDDPILIEARKLEGEAHAAEASGNFSSAKSYHEKAIERYLMMMNLESKGSPKFATLRREVEAVFDRAEKIRGLLKAREKDAKNQPLERAAQLEMTASEARLRGEFE